MAKSLEDATAPATGRLQVACIATILGHLPVRGHTGRAIPIAASVAGGASRNASDPEARPRYASTHAHLRFGDRGAIDPRQPTEVWSIVSDPAMNARLDPRCQLESAASAKGDQAPAEYVLLVRTGALAKVRLLYASWMRNPTSGGWPRSPEPGRPQPSNERRCPLPAMAPCSAGP